MKQALPYLLSVLIISSAAGQLAAQDGQSDLDEATRIQLRLRSPEDVNRVIELCESALEKGLNESGEKFAKQLLVGALWQHSTQYTSPIFDQNGVHPRWKAFRDLGIADLEKLLQYDEEFSDAYMMLARLHALPGGDRGRALAAINKAIELFSEDRRKLSQAYLRRVPLRESEEDRLADLSAAVEADPTYAAAWQTRAQFLVQQGKVDEAVGDSEKLLASEGTEVAVHQAMAEALNNLKRHELALQHLEKAIELAPEQALNYRLRAAVYQDLEKPDEALADLNKALELQPLSANALLDRARMNYVLNNLREARADIESVLAQTPNTVTPNTLQAILVRSMISAAERRYGEAIKDLQVVLRVNPDNVELRLQLASIYVADERPSKAIKLLTTVIEDDAENWQALRTRGDALLSVGKHAEAIEDYNAALELQPEDDGILNNLAWVLATSPKDGVRDGTRAVSLATRACEVTNYEKPHILSTLAAGYAESGDFDNAIKWSTEAVEKGKTDLKDQLEQLQQELESYKQNKPWRELQEVKDKPDAPRRIFEA